MAQELPPSKVLHVSNLPSDIQSDDLIQFLQTFGKVEFVCLLNKHAQALIEMDSIDSAMAVLRVAQAKPVFFKNCQLYFNFSRSQQINRNTGGGGGGGGAAGGASGAGAGAAGSGAAGNANGNNAATGGHVRSTPSHAATGAGNVMSPKSSKVLLLTIINPVYNITCDVLHQIMSPYGNVQRIVIFMKNGVQAMVEFDNEASAAAALRALDGRDIYAGTCTLKIVFSRAESLNVKENDERNRDYTNPALPTSLVALPTAAFQMPAVARAPAAVARTVVLVHGLRRDVTCDQLFNVLCLFGNVTRIKHLPHKPEIALVQYADGAGAEACVRLLHGAPFFDQTLDVRFSKHPTLVSGRAGVDAADQFLSDYSVSPLNRFRRQAVTASKHVCMPSATLYFSNIPAEYGADEMQAFFRSKNVPLPRNICFFDTAHSTRSGLVDMGTVRDAMAAVVGANHSVLAPNTTFKLSFTTNQIKAPLAPQSVATATT